MPSIEPEIVSARPQMTARIMARTGLDEAKLTELVHRFYGKVRADSALGPIFAERISGLGPASEPDGGLLVVGRVDDGPVSRGPGAGPYRPARGLGSFRPLADAVS